MTLKRAFAALVGLAFMAVVVVDTLPRFRQQTVELKRQHQSAQRNWNVFYGQKYVYTDSAIKYQADFTALQNILQPESVVLTDLATSYYVASHLPLYVRNVHRHHGRQHGDDWYRLLQARHACFLDQPERKKAFAEFVDKERLKRQNTGQLEFRYLIVNKDQENLNLKLDCMSQSRTAFISNIDDIAEMVFDGEFLRVYELQNF